MNGGKPAVSKPGAEILWKVFLEDNAAAADEWEREVPLGQSLIDIVQPPRTEG